MIRQGLLVALCAVVTANNDECIKDGAVGVCVSVDECHSASERIKEQDFPKKCGFNNKYESSICCFDHLTTTTAPVTTSLLPTTTEDEFDHDEIVTNTCKDIDPKLTAPRIGQKAWDMCLEYQETLVYPCEKTTHLSFNSVMERDNKCYHDLPGVGMIVEGTRAEKNEFPHMALLGYVAKDTEMSVKWVCGGSLISDKFVLTAGHCIRSRMFGTVSYVYIGALLRSDVNDNPDLMYGVKAIIKHPDYQPPNKYNDIALLELDRRVKLDAYTVPACLPVGDDLNYDIAFATGWGLTAYGGSTSDILQKVNLTKFPSDECKENYLPTKNMVNGYNDTTQICYGDYEESYDTCEGDSGGPLQIQHDKISCMYVVVGITSLGTGCGIVGQPGIYTRVSHYVPWIESVVWP